MLAAVVAISFSAYAQGMDAQIGTGTNITVPATNPVTFLGFEESEGTTVTIQILYKANEFPSEIITEGGGTISSMALFLYTEGEDNYYSDLTVKLGRTTLNYLSLGSWATKLTTVVEPHNLNVRDIDSFNGGSLKLGFDHDYEFDANYNLIVEISYSLTPSTVAHIPGSTTNNMSNRVHYTYSSAKAPAEFLSIYCPDVLFHFPNVEAEDPLPVELSYFMAKQDGDHVSINWETASEKNSDVFVIERGGDTENFEVIGMVDGAGNTNEVMHYEFIDKELFDYTVYYRLKQIDWDGAETVFPIITLKPDVSLENMTVYPNPFVNDIKIDLGGLSTDGMVVELVNLQGKVLRSVKAISNTVKFNRLNELSSGSYFVRMRVGDNILSVNLIKL
jgi:hypothetical protein